MNVKIHYEKAKVSFQYLGKKYSGEVVCSEGEFKTFWFVFDQIDVKPFGGSVEFRLINGELETAKNYLAYPVFVSCIRNAIENHRKELCN
jgi:hypothetical protein